MLRAGSKPRLFLFFIYGVEIQYTHEFVSGEFKYAISFQVDLIYFEI